MINNCMFKDCLVSKKYLKLVKTLVSKIQKVKKDGYWFITPHEELLFGSSPPDQYLKEMHMPRILQDEGISPDLIKKVNKERKKFKYWIGLTEIFGLSDEKADSINPTYLDETNYILCSLGIIGEDGKTVKKSQAIDEYGNVIIDSRCSQ